MSKDEESSGIKFKVINPNPQHRKVLQIKAIEGIIKENSPIQMEKLLSIIEYKLGYSRENAKTKLMVLYDMDKIDVNDTNKMISFGKKKDKGAG